MPLKQISLLYSQDKFIFAKDEYVCLKGTWGCGKSLAGLLAANKECEENPGNLYLVVRKEAVDLWDSTIKDWNDFLGRPIVSRDVRYENGSILMFRHGDDLNSLKNTNLGGALMVQAEEMTESEFWFLSGRLRRQQGTRHLRLECNYDGHNWIYNLFNMRGIGRLITTNTFENEANLPADYIPKLKRLPELLQKRHLFGSDEIGEGLVWPEFDEAKHTCLSFDIPPAWKVGFGLDHGHDHPTAVLFGAMDHDGNLIIYNEHYEAGELISHHAEKIKQIEPEWERLDQIIDHTCRYKTMQTKERVYSIMEAYRDYGFKFRPSIADAMAGVNVVGEMFKNNKIKIFKDKCPNLINEISTWKWKKPKRDEEKYEREEAVRTGDDACKALIYLASGQYDATPKPKDEKDGLTEKRYFEMLENQMNEEQLKYLYAEQIAED